MAPNYNKLKTNLRLAINRLKLVEKKKTELALKARKEIAEYIAGGKDDRARIRVEHIIREDYLVEAMEIIEMYCDLLLARMGLIQQMKQVDDGLMQPICSVLWVCPRLQADIGELKVVSDQFAAKYGKQFVLAAQSDELKCVSEKLMHKLSVQAPPKILVEKYMVEIAKSCNVPFTPDESILKEDEMYNAEAMLIDLGAGAAGGAGGKPGSGPSGGGGGGGGLVLPQIPVDSDPQPGPAPPAPSQQFQPYVPPAGQQPFSYPSPQQPYGSAPHPGYPGYPGHHQPSQTPYQPYHPVQAGQGEKPPLPSGPPTVNQPPTAPNQTYNEPPSYTTATTGPPPPAGLNLPDLPAVPTNSFPKDDSPDIGGGVPGGAPSGGGEDVDFDDLTKRFEELKKKK